MRGRWIDAPLGRPKKACSCTWMHSSIESTFWTVGLSIKSMAHSLASGNRRESFRRIMARPATVWADWEDTDGTWAPEHALLRNRGFRDFCACAVGSRAAPGAREPFDRSDSRA